MQSKVLGLHADNCCGQNKNKTVLGYLAWRVILGLNDEIELDFMRVGHTRCFVDAGFGLLKQEYRKSDVDTVAQLASVMNNSASINEAICFDWDWRAWDSFLKDHFKPVKNITFYQKFRFSATQPGVVSMSGSDRHPDISFRIRKSWDTGFDSSQLPPAIQPAGMSHERAAYLFKEIREFCHEESRDITCPESSSATEEAAATE